MTFWRMQLHPDVPRLAVQHSIQSLAKGFIGLDFADDLPDLRGIPADRLPPTQRHYAAFANEMTVGDRVLLFAHHYPFALARVASNYNHILFPDPHLGIWFRHFRHVDDVRYYGDFVANPQEWEQITMTGTIAPLRDSESQSFRLVTRWLNEV